MPQDNLSVRELQKVDIDHIVQYWLTSDKDFLVSMGVDLNKLPTPNELTQMLSNQLNTPIEKRNAYCIIWLIDNKPIGHCNTNPTVFGEEATMHLHIWNTQARGKGFGITFLKKTLPYLFENLHLKKLYSQPYALNPAPNKILEKVGFEFIREYLTIPGSLNFEQPVKLWELSDEKFKKIKIDF